MELFILIFIFIIVSIVVVYLLRLVRRLQLIKDRLALKYLVDNFSILAGAKDVKSQLLLFTEDALVESYDNGVLNSSFKGREEIGHAFSEFISFFESVNHHNGQQSVDIKGNYAKGSSDCQVTLIRDKNGKKMKTIFGVFYLDEYVRRNGQWLINKRQSMFQWTE